MVSAGLPRAASSMVSAGLPRASHYLARGLLHGLRRPSTRLRMPALDLIPPPFGEVVHVGEELVPGHHARGRVRGHKVRAPGAGGIGSHLLAHLLAEPRELVLQLDTMLG